MEKAAVKADEILAQERRALDEMRAEVEKKREEVDAIISELDSLPPEADLEKLVEDRPVVDPGEERVWWEELGMEGDPFSSNQGLVGIPPAKYDDIVVQTPFVKSYLKKVESTPEDLLGKTIVVIGEFGSGKTTLFQLIGTKAGVQGLFPVFAIISPDVSVARLTHQLVSQIDVKMREAFPYFGGGSEPGSTATLDDIGACIQIMNAARQTAKIRGFVILVDGLHKSETYRRQSMEFLQHLQNLQERLSASGLNCGILVAGSLAWETELRTNPSLSGSFYRIDRVPPLSEESAIESVVRRIVSFVPPGRDTPTIVRERLREAFRVISKRLYRPPTFRDYLDHVRDRLHSRCYSEVGITVALHIETMDRIRREMGTSPLGSGFARLADRKSHSTAFRQALRHILPEIYFMGGISESDRLFVRNKGAFYLLRKEGFIVPRRSGNGRSLVWHLSPYLVEFLQRIQDAQKVPASDALEALFSDPVESLPREPYTIYGSVIKEFPTMAASWRASWPEIADLIEKTKGLIEQVERSSGSVEGYTSMEIVENMAASLRNLLKCVIFATGDREALATTDVGRFDTLWCATKIDNLEAYLKILQRSSPLPADPTHFFGVLHLHAQAVSDLARLLAALIQGESIARISGRRLTREDCISIHDARTVFWTQQYAATVDKIGGLVDGKIKDVLHAALRCARGPKFISMLPPDIQEKLKGDKRGHPRTKRGMDQNFLYDLSRSEYAKVMFHGPIQRMLFYDVTSKDELSELRGSLELVFALEDRTAHRDRPSYFRGHATEIADALKGAPRLAELLNRLADRLLVGSEFSYGPSADGDALEFRFGRPEFQYEIHSLPAGQVEEGISQILAVMENGPLSVPPLDALLTACSLPPEATIGLLRASAGQDLVSLMPDGASNGRMIQLTEKGRLRLVALRGASRVPPSAPHP